MGVLQETLPTLIAGVAREIAVPAGDLGFGADLSCVDDISPDAAVVPPDSPRAVAEAIYRRFTTPRGTLVDDEDYGFDVATMLGKATTAATIQAAQSELRAQALQDDRVDTVSVAITAARLTGAVGLRIEVSGATAAGPFSLTLAVSDGGVLLEEMT
jgi:hypothetical protein